MLTEIVTWLRHNTQSLTEAVRQLVLWSIGVGLITKDFQGQPWTETQTVLTVSAISAFLAVIAAKTNVAVPIVRERIARAHEEGMQAGVAQASSGSGGLPPAA